MWQDSQKYRRVESWHIIELKGFQKSCWLKGTLLHSVDYQDCHSKLDLHCISSRKDSSTHLQIISKGI